MIFKSFDTTEEFSKGKTSRVFEYKIEDADINYSIVEINGRFPEEKWAINYKCKEMVHVLEGSGVFVLGGTKYDIKKDDVILIGLEEKYYFMGNFRLGVSSTPAWFPEQHDILD